MHATPQNTHIRTYVLHTATVLAYIIRIRTLLKHGQKMQWHWLSCAGDAGRGCAWPQKRFTSPSAAAAVCDGSNEMKFPGAAVGETSQTREGGESV